MLSHLILPLLTRIFSDSKSCVDLSYDPVSFKKTKHILRAAKGLQDFVARDVFKMVFITGSVNLADILTKDLDKILHKKQGQGSLSQIYHISALVKCSKFVVSIGTITGPGQH